MLQIASRRARVEGRRERRDVDQCWQCKQGGRQRAATAEQRAAQTQLELRQAQLQLLVNHVRLLGLVAQANTEVFERLSGWFE